MKHKLLMESLDQARVVRAIEEAERKSSGEIRVHIQPSSHGREVRNVAEKTFERLGMTKTGLRNGVLLFILSRDQKFAILGDKGVNEKVGEGYWEHIAAELGNRFRAGEFTEGIVNAVEDVGQLLAEHFPHSHRTDVNELTNELSIHHDDDHPPSASR